jgi:hypothetical protein
MHDWLYTAFYIACGMLNVAILTFHAVRCMRHAAKLRIGRAPQTAAPQYASRGCRCRAYLKQTSPGPGADVVGPTPKARCRCGRANPQVPVPMWQG